MSIRGNKVLSGTWGEIWVDGVPIIEFKKIEAKVSANREEVQMGIDIDSKMTGLKGEISITINKTYSNYNDVMKNYIQGKDVRSQVIAKLADPDAVDAQQER